MTAEAWLKATSKKLNDAGVGTAQLDSLVLLEDESGKDRGWLLAHPEFTLQGPSLQKLNTKVMRRTEHEPLAYIRGFTEFYGRRFIVSQSVLEPRPESEAMIDLLKELVPRLTKNPVVIDIGTGSGALGITAKLELPATEVIATDIDPNCVKIARQNAEHLGTKLDFIEGDLLEPIVNLDSNASRLIYLANLPYVPTDWQVNSSAALEPQIALYGGVDGLDVYRRLFKQIDKQKKRPKFVLTESMPPQHQTLAEIASQSGYSLTKTQDFIQLYEIN